MNGQGNCWNLSPAMTSYVIVGKHQIFRCAKQHSVTQERGPSNMRRGGKFFLEISMEGDYIYLGFCEKWEMPPQVTLQSLIGVEKNGKGPGRQQRKGRNSRQSRSKQNRKHCPAECWKRSILAPFLLHISLNDREKGVNKVLMQIILQGSDCKHCRQWNNTNVLSAQQSGLMGSWKPPVLWLDFLR